MQNFVRNFFIFLLLLGMPVVAGAEAAPTVEVTGVIHSDFSRIIFHTILSGPFQPTLQGNLLQITLPNPINANFRSMLRTLNAEVASASLEKSGRKIIIRLKSANMHFRKVQGQNFFGVDLVKQDKAETKTVPPQKVAPPAVKKPKVTKPPVEKKKEKPKTKAKVDKKPLKKTTPPKKKPEPEDQNLSLTPGMPARVVPTKATKLLTIPWEKMVSAAIYVRGDRLWMVFDYLVKAPLEDLPKPFITAAEQVPDRQATLLKLTLSPELAKNPDLIWATREDNNWVLYYGKPPVEKPIPISIPEDESENQIKLMVKHAAEPFNMLDPEVGDALFVVPVRDSGNRVLPGRHFIEFEVLPTIQGVVLLRHSDKLLFKVGREGVVITSKQKLLTSPVVKEMRTAETHRGKLEKKSMYPFAQQNDAAPFMPIYYQYLKDLQAEPEATHSALHLKMAEHYFANEYYAESLGLLRNILVDDPEFSATAGIKPLIAGNLFMMERYGQAEDTFSNILENKEQPHYAEEQKLWRWASEKMMEQQNLIAIKEREPFDVVAAFKTYLPSYPYPLRRKLLMVYIQSLMNEGRTGAARGLFKDVSALNPTKEQSEMLKFLEARALIIDGKTDLGAEHMKEVLAHSSNPRVHTLALLESTRIAKDSGKMPLTEAIAALEKGRIEWRGDAVELQFLKQLGQYYIENKQYTEGLRTWRELVTQFSGTTESLKVSADMEKVFVTLFDTDGAAYKLPPLQTLGTFFEFNELTPIGAQGDRISRLLADYLASVDLLENAAAILTHQVRFRSQGEERAKLAAKLIDLHLANNRPDLAKDVMDAMAKEKTSDALKSRYRVLNAEILVQQGKYPEALKQLEKEDDQTARDLKLAVSWHEQEWEHVIGILEPELKARAAKTDTLSSHEENNVLRLAIAYSKLRRFNDLKTLKELYGKRIKNPKVGDAFDFVSDSNTPVDHEELDSSLELNKIGSFLKKYHLPEPPASAPVPAPAATKDPAGADKKKAEGADKAKKPEEKTESKKE